MKEDKTKTTLYIHGNHLLEYHLVEDYPLEDHPLEDHTLEDRPLEHLPFKIKEFANLLKNFYIRMSDSVSVKYKMN